MERRNTLALVLIPLFGIAFVGTALASGVALTGVGARATALAGAYRGVASDWSAMYWNPAGLTQIDGWQIGGSLEFIHPVAKFTAAPWVTPLGDTTRFSAFREGDVQNKPRTFFVPAGGIAYSNGTWALGLSVFAPFGLGATWDLMNTQDLNPAYPEYEYDDDLQMIDVHPTVAYALNDRISVGAGFSVMFDKIMIRKPSFIPNPFYSDDLKLVASFARLKTRGLLSAPYTHLIVDTKLQGTGISLGGNVGVLFKPTDKLSIGLSYRAYSDANIEGSVDGTIYFFREDSVTNHILQSNLVKGQLDKALADGKITESQYYVILNSYSGNSAVVYDHVNATATMPLPANLGLGLAYRGLPNTLLTLDVDVTYWSAWDVIDIELENGDKSQLKELWKDCVRVSFGFEHDFGSFVLRGGYYTEPEAANVRTLTPTIPDISRRNTVNLGFSLPLGQRAVLHASAEKIFMKDRKFEQWLLNDTGDDYDNVAGTYRMDVFNAMIGLEYQF